MYNSAVLSSELPSGGGGVSERTFKWGVCVSAGHKNEHERTTATTIIRQHARK